MTSADPGSRVEEEQAWRATAAVVLAHYPFTAVRVDRIPQGLINLTARVTTSEGTDYVLQRLNPVFPASVNDNLARVTAHLRRRGLLTPELVPTRTGAPSVSMADGAWRVLTFVPGRARDALAGPAQAHAAGALLARFHGALLDFDGELAGERGPVHDLERHLAKLDAALSRHRAHRHAAAARALAARLREALEVVPPFAREPLRLVHGDPKISNVMFDARGARALCLIDLDTLARMPLAFELGDAMRSWCNPHGEDAVGAEFDLELFAAAVRGYSESARGFVTSAELDAIVPATLHIHVELAARFLADALEERYFAWDARRYAARGDHNLARARAQLAVGASLAARRAAADAVVARVRRAAVGR